MDTSRFFRRHTARVACVGLAFAATAMLAPTTPAAAAPKRPDLALTMDTSRPAVIPGEAAGVTVFTSNAGTDVSGPLTLTLTAPASLTPVPGSSVDPSWTCTSAGSTWTCQHAPLGPGETAVPVGFAYQTDATVPGDVLDFTAQVAPDTHEESVTNNVAQGSVQVVAPGVIRGTVWLDTNRDGQREPGEPPVSSQTPGLISISASPRTNPDGSQSHAGSAVAQADGSYSMTLEPGFFVVLVEVQSQVFHFALPNVGDDATDSDLDNFEGDPLVDAGLSDLIRLASGDDTVIDVGLIPAS